MTENPKIKLDVDKSELEKAKSEYKKYKEESTKGLDATDQAIKTSRNEVIGFMRSSYMMVSGLTQIMGGDMGQIISSIYGIGVATIGTYEAIAAAMAASGVGAIQAALMSASLIAALAQLAGVMSGETEMARTVGNINMALQGFGGMVDNYSIY